MEAFRQIPLGSIDPSPTNPRKTFDKDKLAELAESIRAKGVLQPVLVRPRLSSVATNKREQMAAEAFGIAGEPRYQLVAGERRLRAAKLARLAEIPAIVRELNDLEVLEVQVVENEQRDDVTPLEKAEGYGRLMDVHGLSAEDVAAKVGKSVATIRGLAKLRSLPDKAKAALDAGELTAAVAGLIARIPGEKARAEATTLALAKGQWDGERPSFRAVKEHIQARYMIELKQAPFSQTDKDLVPGLPTCKACPKRAGNNRELYPDTRADVCTDPECYARKVTMHRGRMYQQARSEGVRLLDGDETETAIRMGLGRFGRSKWVDLAEEWHIDGNAKTVAEWLKGALDERRVFACGEDGKARYLVPRAEVERIFEAESRAGADKRKAREAREDRKAAGREPSEWDVERAARDLALSEVHSLARANFESLDALAAQGGPDTDAAYQALQILAWHTALSAKYYGTGEALMAELIPGVSVDDETLADMPDRDKAIAKWMADASPRDLLAFLLYTAAEDLLQGWREEEGDPVRELLLNNFTDAGSWDKIKAAAIRQIKAERAAKAKPSANGHAANGKPKKAKV